VTLAGRTVAVVFGSRSVEHEISILTACQLMPVLAERGAEVIPVYITKEGAWLSRPTWREVSAFRGSLPTDGDPVGLDLAAGQLAIGTGSWRSRPRRVAVDAVFPCTHGPLGEDGTIAGLCQMARIPCVGCGPGAAALVMHKGWCKQVLAAAGLPVAPGVVVAMSGAAAATLAAARAAAERLGYPVVVKPTHLGSSIGVTMVEGPAQLSDALDIAFAYDTEVVVEGAVPAAEDLNCAVKRGAPRASAVERPLRRGGILSYADKYAHGGKLGSGAIGPGKGAGEATWAKQPDGTGAVRELPADLPQGVAERVQALARSAYDACACAGTVRVDFLMPADAPDLLVVNELNPIPGSLAFYLWTASGVPFGVLAEELVEEALAGQGPPRLTLPGNLLAAGLPPGLAPDPRRG